MKKVFFLLYFTFIFLYSFGQNTNEIKQIEPFWQYRSFPKNSIFGEFCGNSMFIGSLNYERVFSQRNDKYTSVRVGLGGKGESSGSWLHYSTISVPILINRIIQVSNSFAYEIGIGTTLTYSTSSAWEVVWWSPFGSSVQKYKGGTFFDPLITTNIGIRVANDGFLFRLGFTPVVNFLHLNVEIREYSVIPENIGYWFGLSIGFSF